MTIDERFNAKVSAQPDGCMLWTGAQASNGYGSFRVEGRTWKAHRWAWTRANGRVPNGLDLDHLCRNRLCVNVDHLEMVTRQENLLRGDGPRLTRERAAARTHCRRGHLYTDPYVPGGKRRCKACEALRVPPAPVSADRPTYVRGRGVVTS